MDRLERLLRRCEELGLLVLWADLGELRRGEYHHDARVIVLSSRLTGPQAVACLAHELGHAHFGHATSTPAHEARAWDHAAALVLSPDEYADAEHRVGQHPAALALELGVTPRLVVAWQQWWRRRGRREAS